VIASCRRRGSLDSAIAPDSIVPNDFAVFFAAHPQITSVCFNGAKAEEVFRRRVQPALENVQLHFVRLPSTSPANASWSYERKLAAWRDALSM
ncbi:MAG: DNA-deoxyinosine glycosylase, partial [Xanthomonadales bacterium]|nr:DNA-deoxyinosine glycosylase [Xanthomonadales bacterium]